MLGHDDADATEGTSPWPAFADLLAATTLLFLILFAAVAIPAIRKNRINAGRQDRLDSLLVAMREVSQASGGKIQVQTTGGYVRIRIPENATFPQRQWDLASIRPEGREILHQFAQRVRTQHLADRYIEQIQVVGHTSVEGGDTLNWYLSARRAVTVALYLIQEEGLSPCKVTALGRGSFYPVDPEGRERTGQIRAEDRRIELELRPLVTGSGNQPENGSCVEHWPSASAARGSARTTPSAAVGQATMINPWTASHRDDPPRTSPARRPVGTAPSARGDSM